VALQLQFDWIVFHHAFQPSNTKNLQSCKTSSINAFSSAVGCLSFIPNVGAFPSIDAEGSSELPPRDADIVRIAVCCVA
jgi:hypothetical protein